MSTTLNGIWLLAMLLIVFVAGCSPDEREYVLLSIPARPDMSGWPDRLVMRIENAELQALKGADAVGSLAELSRIYHANGFLGEAAFCYQGLIELEPREAKWPHLLAEILSNYGQLDDALPYRQLTVELDSVLPGLVRLGDVYLKQNRIDEARQVYLNALKKDDGNPYALVGLARIDVGKGDFEEAQRRLESATRTTENRIGADLLATVYEERGLSQLASAIRGRAKSSGSFSDIPDPWLFEIYSESFDTYQMSVAAGMADHGGDSAACYRLLSRAIQLAPRDASLHYQLGLSYLKAGITSKAIKSFEETVAVDPGFSDGWFQMAGIYTKQGNAEAEARTLAAGLYHNPDSPGLHLANSARLKALGDYKGAINEAEKAIELRPEEADPYVSLAVLYIIQSEYSKGVDLLKTALKRESLHPLALSTLAVYSTAEGFEAEAREYIRLARLQPRVPVKDLKDLEMKFQQRFGKAP